MSSFLLPRLSVSRLAICLSNSLRAKQPRMPVECKHRRIYRFSYSCQKPHLKINDLTSLQAYDPCKLFGSLSMFPCVFLNNDNGSQSFYKTLIAISCIFTPHNCKTIATLMLSQAQLMIRDQILHLMWTQDRTLTATMWESHPV